MKYDLETVNLRDDNSTQSLILRSIVPGSTVLEFGPATGYMTRYMKEELNCLVYCVEIDPEAAQLAGRYAQEMVVADIDEEAWIFQLSPREFDSIIFADVLEHLRDPLRALSLAAGLLKPHGSILTSIPNIAHNAVILGLLNGQFRYTPTGLLDESHIHFFTRESILDLLDKAGLCPVTWQGTFLDPMDTELRQTYIGLPDPVATFLLGREDRHVHEYVTISKRCQDVNADERLNEASTVLEEPLQDATHYAQLFWETEAGFTEKSSLMGVARPDNKTRTIEFQLPLLPQMQDRQLRLDPVAFRSYVWVGDSVIHEAARRLEHRVRWQGLTGAVEVNAGATAGVQEFLCLDEDPQLVSLGTLPEWIGDGNAKLTVTLRASQNILELKAQLGSLVTEWRSSREQLKQQIHLNEELGEEWQNSREQVRLLKNRHEEIGAEWQYSREQVRLLKSRHEETAAQWQNSQEQIRQLKSQNEEIAAEWQHLQERLKKLKFLHEELHHNYAETQQLCDEFRSTLQSMEASKSWRYTLPLRIAKKPLRKGSAFCRRLLPAIKKASKYVFIDKKLSLRPAALKLNLQKFFTAVQVQPETVVSDTVSQEELQRQREHVFAYQPQISLITPTYNTTEEFLAELIDSLQKQTYQNWELCIADGASHPLTVSCLKKWQDSDPRLKIAFLDSNRGIAGNTVQAFELSCGDYVVLLDHDDYLTEDALFEVVKCVNRYGDVDFIYSDRGVFSDKTRELLACHYLPGYSPDFLRSCNYASHLNAFSRWIIEKVGFEREGYDGSQDYEFELRVAEQARRIVNIPKALYYCRACEGSVALDPESKMYAYSAGKKAIEEHIHRIGYPGEVQFLRQTFSYRIRYELKPDAKISIIIPNMDHVTDLRRCLDSIFTKTTYEDFDVTIVENNSQSPETFSYYEQLELDGRIRVLHYPHKGFNFSALNNWAAQYAAGKYLLLLNNDTEVIAENWLEEMLMFAQREDVGAVGAKLYYPNDTIQHAGLIIGLGGHIAAHYDHGKNRYETGYMNRLTMPQNYCAVTAACLLLKKSDYLSVNGLDETNFTVGLNDVDLCLKLRKLGKVNVVTPYAELYHHESLSRGLDTSGGNQKRFLHESAVFRNKWKSYFISGDPYHNPHIR